MSTTFESLTRRCTQKLYAGGSRSFFVFNVPPEGCIPYILTLYEGKADELGCMSEYNEVVEVYNAQLNSTVTEYRSRWSDASILFFDTYGASKVLYNNPEAYGESQINQIFQNLPVITKRISLALRRLK